MQRLGVLVGHLSPASKENSNNQSALRTHSVNEEVQKSDDGLPEFDKLPIDPSFPPQSSQGIWGEEDQLGTVNLLTPARVASAAALIETGKVFPLNWQLELPDPPLFGRTSIRHEILNTKAHPNVRDDVYQDFNTQASSQWDGLTHFGHSKHGFYNGVQGKEITGTEGTKLGMENMARKGLAGRLVLLDFERWILQTDPFYSPRAARPISADELQKCAEAQDVKFEVGDVLLLRTGFIRWYNGASVEERAKLPKDMGWAGAANTEEMKRFLWDNHFAAVASDNPSFEVWPPQDPPMLHETLIGMWGMMIGEMFDCEALADDCASDGRYQSFFTSAPLNKLGGVGSPPNALAIK